MIIIDSIVAYETGDVILIPEGLTEEQLSQVRKRIVKSCPPGISLAKIGTNRDVLLIEPKIPESTKRKFLQVALEKIQVGVTWLQDNDFIIDTEELRIKVLGARG